MDSRDIIKRLVSYNWYYEDCKPSKSQGRAFSKAARQAGKAEIKNAVELLLNEPMAIQEEMWDEEASDAWDCHFYGVCRTCGDR